MEPPQVGTGVEDCLNRPFCLADGQGCKAEVVWLRKHILGWELQHQPESTVSRIQIPDEYIFSAHRKIILEEYLLPKKMRSD